MILWRGKKRIPLMTETTSVLTQIMNYDACYIMIVLPEWI